MAAGMMRAEATKNRDVDADILMRKLGKYYQLRDDYNDLIPSKKVCFNQLSLAETRTLKLVPNFQLAIH